MVMRVWNQYKIAVTSKLLNSCSDSASSKVRYLAIETSLLLSLSSWGIIDVLSALKSWGLQKIVGRGSQHQSCLTEQPQAQFGDSLSRVYCL